MSELILSPAEARVVAALVEKSLTTPQYYPMTVNAIMLAANQKSSRNPVMNLSEGEVGAALNRLEQERLCARDSFSSRAVKWRQQFQHQMMLKPATQALLVALMLRGPQTAAELRANAAALGGPADAEGFAAAMQDLADRSQPLVGLLPRAAGQKEARYAHRLCGEGGLQPVEEEVLLPAATAAPSTTVAALLARIEALEARVAQLEQNRAGTPGPDA